MQYDTTVNRWHTSKNTARINASNPCSEYMFLDDSACNLASLNLLKFAPNGTFDVEGAIGRELQEVQAGQVAGGIVEEHVLRAWVAGIDASRVFRSVPAVDRGVVLHAGIASGPGHRKSA